MLSVILHGGAGRFSPESTPAKLPFLRQALDAAWAELVAGKPGEFAVAAALRVMEGCELFNAGYGGYPNIDGIVLLDIGLMKGSGEFMSLMNIRRLKYPSAVALDMLQAGKGPLMTVWTHELMTAVDCADPDVKERYGWVATHEELVAPRVRKMLPADIEIESADGEGAHGTIGCVVRDVRGGICAGTSTGGVSRKPNGRIGDTPVIGSGVYADDEIGGLSTTGDGEAILAAALSGFVVAEMRSALRADAAAFVGNPSCLGQVLQRELTQFSRRRPEKAAAIIVVPKEGMPAFAYSGGALSMAMRSGGQEMVRVWLRDGGHIE